MSLHGVFHGIVVSRGRPMGNLNNSMGRLTGVYAPWDALWDALWDIRPKGTSHGPIISMPHRNYKFMGHIPLYE